VIIKKRKEVQMEGECTLLVLFQESCIVCNNTTPHISNFSYCVLVCRDQEGFHVEEKQELASPKIYELFWPLQKFMSSSVDQKMKKQTLPLIVYEI
jgi:hypothetical protein